MAGKVDYYTLLGIRRSASADEVRQAYFDAARRLHPDTNVAPGETELFLDAQQAYEVLSNPKRREQYDASLPPEQVVDYSLDQTIIYSRESLLGMDEPQLVYVLLNLSVPENSQEPPAPPLNFCLVLDRSTSMQGSGLDVLKDTTIQIMRKLKPHDFFSVVVFSDKAEVLIPATRVDDYAKLEARIQMIQCSGGTEIFSGLELGYNEVLRNISRAQINHIILLTDGRTYGDEEKCLELARNASERGIGISGLGIGPEWNDHFLDELASRTGGSSMYISRSQDIQRALMEKFNRLSKAYAEETRLEFKVPEGIDFRYAFRLQPDAGLLPYLSPMLMGPVVREVSLKVLMEFIIQPAALQKSVVTLLEGTLHATLSMQALPSYTTPLRIIRPVLSEAPTDPPPVEVVEALSRLKLYRLQEQARIELSEGNFDQAAEHLTRLATHLLARRGTRAGQDCPHGSREHPAEKVVYPTRWERDKIWNACPAHGRGEEEQGMIICPNCQHKEMSGAIYCSKCGAQLVDSTIATHKIHTAETRSVTWKSTRTGSNRRHRPCSPGSHCT